MKLILTALIAALILLQCNSPVNSSIQYHGDYTNSDLEGHWTLSKVESIKEKQSIAKYKAAIEKITRDGPFLDGFEVYLDKGTITPSSPSAYFSRKNRDMVIGKDSICHLNYPLELDGSSFYTVYSDSLQIGNNKNVFINLNAEKDTLDISYLDFYGLYVTETYFKAAFDDSILDILEMYKTNFPVLAGEWKLMREYDYDYGTSYILDFPFDLPDTILVKKEDFTPLFYEDRNYNLSTNGKKRKYFLEYDGSFLRFTPGSWFDGDNPYIHYRRIGAEK